MTLWNVWHSLPVGYSYQCLSIPLKKTQSRQKLTPWSLFMPCPVRGLFRIYSVSVVSCKNSHGSPIAAQYQEKFTEACTETALDMAPGHGLDNSEILSG